MIREFYTKDEQFVVSSKRIFRNGEIIAEGTVEIQRLCLDQPACFVVSNGNEHPPTYFETKVVSAVLPRLEYCSQSHRDGLQTRSL
ncbi:hypothetical protein AWM68_17250 [Fictibacillus phosphorivorans]|uniref:Uncharacterized protein n=1 Tax=Fictibacillus phosphorivorans TaxID=1221500 RepID=A0A165NW41_9BACL|nr:hypothetical protein [Fictibacillus phosphorivorans]KZE67920.1 hypothetical protein AWM68_17250 [Fictibacillus phosphorivorans]